METTGRIEPLEVVVAGGGVAGIEALLALRDLGERQLGLTLLAPNDELVLRPLSVGEAFGLSQATRYPLATIAERIGARLVRDAVRRVLVDDRVVLGADGAELGYDALVLATGARRRPAYPGALTFTDSADSAALAGLVGEVERGRASTIAFVVPPGVTWPLPLYELALMTAHRVSGARLLLVTPEVAPLALFGDEASRAVAEVLAEARIATRLDAHASVAPDGRHLTLDGTETLRVDAVVALPLLEGPRLRGVPVDGGGFIPIDAHGRVRSLDRVWAAGDGTDYPVKQGGLATQQADAAARDIAALAGAPVRREPFEPVLRGRLMTGGTDRFLRHDSGDVSTASTELLWWPPAKVNGRYLAPWLAVWDAKRAAGRAEAYERPPREGIDVEVRLPRAHDPAGLALDPYSPLGVPRQRR